MQIILTHEEVTEAVIGFATGQIALRDGQSIKAHLESLEDGGYIAVIDIVAATEDKPEPTKPARRRAAPAEAKTGGAGGIMTITAKSVETVGESADNTVAETKAEEKAAEPVTEAVTQDNKDDQTAIPDAAAKPSSLFASAGSSAPPLVQESPAVTNAKSLFANLGKPS